MARSKIRKPKFSRVSTRLRPVDPEGEALFRFVIGTGKDHPVPELEPRLQAVQQTLEELVDHKKMRETAMHGFSVEDFIDGIRGIYLIMPSKGLEMLERLEQAVAKATKEVP